MCWCICCHWVLVCDLRSDIGKKSDLPVCKNLHKCRVVSTCLGGHGAITHNCGLPIYITRHKTSSNVIDNFTEPNREDFFTLVIPKKNTDDIRLHPQCNVMSPRNVINYIMK